MYIRASVLDILNEPVDVRINIANTTKDPRLLGALASDPDRVVRGVASRNPNMPIEYLKQLARDPDCYVRNNVVTSPIVTPEIKAMAEDMEFSGIVNFCFVFSIDDIDNIEDTRAYLEPILRDYIEDREYQYLGWKAYSDEGYLDDNEIEVIIMCKGIYGVTHVQDLKEELIDLIDQAGYVVSDTDYDMLLKR